MEEITKVVFVPTKDFSIIKEIQNQLRLTGYTGIS
jgi:hypothetical protein